MTRHKVPFAFIRDEKKRKATFKKRANGLMNKVRELSILCGINACAIVYSPNDTEPMVCPSILGVQRVISQFNKMPETTNFKHMLNQETFLRQRIDKVNEQLRKKKTQNSEKQVTELMVDCLLMGERRLQNVSQSDINDLLRKIDQKLEEINKRTEGLRNTTTLQQVSTPPSEPLIPSTLQQVASPLPVALPMATPPLILMAQQQVVPSRPPTLLQPLMPMALQQVAPPLLEPLVPIVASDQMQQNIGQVQGNQLPLQFRNWDNQPMDYMVYGQGGENQMIMRLTNNSTIAWPSASYDLTSPHLAPNHYGFP